MCESKILLPLRRLMVRADQLVPSEKIGEFFAMSGSEERRVSIGHQRRHFEEFGHGNLLNLLTTC